MTTPAPARPRYSWPSRAVAIAFALLYAYVLWSAIGNLILLPTILGADSTPWWLLVLDVALPAVVYAAAFLLGRRRGLGVRALLFLAGLALLACVAISSVELAPLV
ncbi:hypothetical protein [Galbitalea soli]|uniref:Uncharacterized protein n=1 Tax=Galbitalea soli TaxID=1268042 RepID=A0A7C9PN77_9MICO|nr:hypothetical protein [Galbitalea soli]NEM91452.1 hypothetical protein [Galbitalea soli]NYJ30145.1 hypothetical protein [Galbitalea soli]